MTAHLIASIALAISALSLGTSIGLVIVLRGWRNVR